MSNGLLALDRKEGEDIIIGNGPDAIKVTVVKIHSSRVRLVISAPKDVPVDRKEVRDRIAAGEDRRKRPRSRRVSNVSGTGGMRFA